MKSGGFPSAQYVSSHSWPSSNSPRILRVSGREAFCPHIVLIHQLPQISSSRQRGGESSSSARSTSGRPNEKQKQLRPANHSALTSFHKCAEGSSLFKEELFRLPEESEVSVYDQQVVISRLTRCALWTAGSWTSRTGWCSLTTSALLSRLGSKGLLFFFFNLNITGVEFTGGCDIVCVCFFFDTEENVTWFIDCRNTETIKLSGCKLPGDKETVVTHWPCEVNAAQPVKHSKSCLRCVYCVLKVTVINPSEQMSL